MAKVIGATVFFLFALGAFVVRFLQFRGKGPLLNNAWLWVSPQERKQMDTKPHYRQSGMVFALIGLLFLILTLEVLFDAGWLYYIFGAVVLGTIVYTVVSSAKTK